MNSSNKNIYALADLGFKMSMYKGEMSLSIGTQVVISAKQVKELSNDVLYPKLVKRLRSAQKRLNKQIEEYIEVCSDCRNWR